MNKSIIRRFAAVICALTCCVFAFGCAPGANTEATEAQQANRAYMSQVNEAMAELDDNLDQFLDAVSRGDVVNMQTQADNAFKVLDKLSAVEAPEELSGVRDKYVEGSGKLREALTDYIALYVEAQNAGDTYNWSAFDKKVKEIQTLYDAGVGLLEEGDKTAAEL